MNIDNIKKEFPIFNSKVYNNDLVYLDSANSSQKPQVVIDRIARTPNIIRSHKNTLFTNMPKRTGIIKPTKPANTFGLPKNEDALCPQDTYAILL